MITRRAAGTNTLNSKAGIHIIAPDPARRLHSRLFGDMAVRMSLDVVAERVLARLEAEHLLREPRLIDGAQGPEVGIGERQVLCLCSNNYLGLADHPDIARAVRDALERFGFGACASRHISGSMSLHAEVEQRTAAFVGQERSLFFATGYGANMGVLQALGSPRTLILSDALNHASLIDGCRLGRSQVHVYRHGDAEHCAHLLREHRAGCELALIVTESLFSMDGDVAPLRELRALADRFDAALIVDDAHAFGVYGPAGRGLCSALDVVPDVLTGTFGKAFGASGAFVAARAPVIRWIENRARSYVFSTAPSPVVPAAVLAAFELVERADDRRSRLSDHARALRKALVGLDYKVPPGESHIIPVMLGDASAATQLSAALLERGVFVHGIRPPTVPAGTSRLRINPMATHTTWQIDFALEQLRALRG